MPFGRVQFVLFWLYQVLVLIWQWPMWPPLALLYFAMVALVVWRQVPEQPMWPGILGAALLMVLAAAFVPHTRVHALFTMFNVVSWIFLWRRQNVTDYLLVFILNIAGLFLLLVIRPDALQRGLILSPMFFPVFIAAIFFLVLRYDMETHYIVKHRLGRQSRRVEVGRLLQSRRVLDVPMLGLILGTGLSITGFALLSGYAAAPVLGRVQWTRVVPSDFSQSLDVGRLGRPLITGRAQLTIRADDQDALRGAVYWRGQVFDRYTDGVWLRAPLSWPSSAAPGGDPAPCARFEVTHDNAALSDGYAPLFVQWARAAGSPLRLATDGRVRLTARTREYSICVAPGTRTPGSAPPPARLPERSAVALWSSTVVSPKVSFEENVAAVSRFLEAYRYDEAYPQVPAGRDPLVHFLGHSRKGPCGLFASVAVFFLTEAGIPARLVTGFSHGRMTSDARRFTDADAHSWVEAWHPRRGWVTLDPTRSARLTWRSSRPAGEAARMRLGWIVAASIPSFLAFFWLGIRLGRRRQEVILPRAPQSSSPIRKISQTTLEAQLLFQELVSGPQFAQTPRLPGEAAMNYSRRLELVNHPKAERVREAAELAGRILFSRIDPEDKMEFLIRLRQLRHG